jgi:hypothetical protein
LQQVETLRWRRGVNRVDPGKKLAAVDELMTGRFQQLPVVARLDALPGQVPHVEIFFVEANHLAFGSGHQNAVGSGLECGVHD